jgi:hypothetical protein
MAAAASNDYELERAQRIAENRRRLEVRGLDEEDADGVPRRRGDEQQQA